MDENIRDGIYELLSRNEDKEVRMITEEEVLQTYINELKREFEKDIRNSAKQEKKRGKPRAAEEHEDLQKKYPLFSKRLEVFTTRFHSVNSGLRRLMLMPTFLVGLMMASRVGQHYQHASWFKVTSFMRMVEVHGSVSGAIAQDDDESSG